MRTATRFKNLKTILFLGLGLSATVANMGCVSWRALAISDHPRNDQTLIEVQKSTSYFVLGSSAHQFYSCVDRADGLDCTLLCGGTTDLQCPSASSMSGYGHSNVR